VFESYNNWLNERNLRGKSSSEIYKDFRKRGFSYQEIFDLCVIQGNEAIVRWLLKNKRRKIKVESTNDYLLKVSINQNNNIYNILKQELEMGGKAIKDVRPLSQDEMLPTYEWVEQNILPLLYLDKKDAIPIGSFGKKPKNETSGDIDVAINANKFMTNGLKFEDIAIGIDYVLNEEEGFDTTLLKGFDQVSVSVPINGDPKNGYAQVDLMPSPDLNWAKFMYHSPNLSEEESKYKGAVRNALMMALISESTKEITKLFEGQTEEYNSLAIRFPTGVWNIKRSLMGKKGKIIKKGVVLESEFITRNPQDVIDLALGEGYGIAAANSFETLWEVIHRKNFNHKSKINEIISKFAVNLKSMRQDIPNEALIKYPEILREDLKDVLKPKTKNELKKASQIYIKKLVNKLGIDEKIIKILYDNNYFYDVSGSVCDTKIHWFKHKFRNKSRMPYEGGYFGIDKNTLFKNVKKDIEKYSKGEFEPIVEGMEDILVPKSLDNIQDDVLNKINSGEISLDLLYIIHNKISLNFISKHILTDLFLSLLNKKLDKRRGNTFLNFKKNYNWIKEYLTKDLWNNVLVRAAYKDLKEKYPDKFFIYTEPKTLKEIREIEKNIKFEKEKTSFLRFFNLLKGDSSYKSIQRIIQLRIKKNQFKFLVFIFDLMKYHKNSYHTLNYIEKIYNLMDRRIEEIPRAEFRILLAKKQWGLEFIDNMIGVGLLDFFKKGNKQLIKLNTNYEDSVSYDSYNYNKMIEYLTDQIEKFGIKEII